MSLPLKNLSLKGSVIHVPPQPRAASSVPYLLSARCFRVTEIHKWGYCALGRG